MYSYAYKFNTIVDEVFLGGLCNTSTYTNPTTEESVNVPFVPCGQAYANGNQIIVNGLPMVIGSGE